jgi:hypothetical protein
MPTIRLIRRVPAPTGRGPGNGQFALQRALAARAPAWLRIGGVLHEGEVPWFWCWADREAAAMCAHTGQPFIAGPNVLFEDSSAPCRLAAEREICHAANCRLLFTESPWYRDLIEEHRGPANRAPIVVWPYPIEPKPGGPLAADYDLLVYQKSGTDAQALAGLLAAWPRHARIRYGRYRREGLFALARRSRCCMYFSEDDRGPLALAEILLAGCPVVGIPRGAPFIEHGRTGALLNGFRAQSCLEAVRFCHSLDRDRVAGIAAEQFDTQRIVEAILAALERYGAKERMMDTR